MSEPNVKVTVEPSEGSSVVYLPLAAPNSNGKPAGQLSLVLNIENQDTVDLHLNKVAVLFTNPPSIYSFDADLNIAKGSTGVWNSIVAQNINQNIILQFPPPTIMTINLHFDGFNDPATVTKSLIPYSNKIPKGSYIFPGSAYNLDPGEFWVGMSAAHGSGTAGIQLFAYDMGVIAWDPNISGWSELKPLPPNTKPQNKDYRIWRKRVYAMADGKVYEFRKDRPDNTDPPNILPENIGPLNGCGNYFSIKDGSEIVNYYHLRDGSLNTDLCVVGKQVHAGDFLGEVGNSGTSSNPHLHIHAIKGAHPDGFPGAHLDGFPLPICFHDINVVEQDLLDWAAMWSVPWVKVDGQGLPNVRSAILPFEISLLPSAELAKWASVVRIIFGVVGDGDGLVITPSGKPGPIDPHGPLRHLSYSKRDILLGLAITEIASIAGNSEARSHIEKVGTDVMSKAVKELQKTLG
jgi:hypothetical protein